MQNHRKETARPSKSIMSFGLRERACMDQILKGESLVGIANTLGITERTVCFYLVNVARKFRLLELCLKAAHDAN